MSQSRVKARTDVEVSTFTNSYSYAINETVSLLLKYANQRGLDTNYLTRNREVIEDGLWTWFAGRYVEKAVLEVVDPAADRVVERLDIPFSFTAPDEIDDETVEQLQEQAFESIHQDILDRVQELDAPPENAQYRLVVTLTENENGQAPPPVDGWVDTSLGDTDHLSKEDLGEWLDAGAIEAAADLWTASDQPGTQEADQ